MKLSAILDPMLILPNLEAATQNEAFEEMARLLAPKIGIDPAKIALALSEREATRSTALERTGVAIPHARLNGIANFTLLVARSKAGIDFKAEDGSPTNLFFIIVGPENQPGEYLKLLARVAMLCHSEEFRSRLLKAPSKEEIRDEIAREDAKG